MDSPFFQRVLGRVRFAVVLFLAVALLGVILPRSGVAQQKRVYTPSEQAVIDQIRGLRGLPDDVRARTTKELALRIRKLPSAPNKLLLANGLANLSTEGDPGHDTLQEVATTLADALREMPVAPGSTSDSPYMELAQLVRYENVDASCAAPQFAQAMSKLEADDEHRRHIDFTLEDLSGKQWSLKDLRGKVVLVNFWATWCPPCRREMPTLDSIYKRFGDRGLVVLGISDEDAKTLNSYLAEHSVAYPVLMDEGRKVNELFRVDGIPRTYVYDRTGTLAAQAIDMRTEKAFLQMLAKAGLQ